MKYIADLHIHSPYSRATSKASNLAGLAAWAGIKGIDVVGSGDFTHPGWFSRIREQLKPAEPGFFKLRSRSIPPVLEGINPDPERIRFVLTAEISSIYKRHDRVRKIHNILFAPDFASVERINSRLAGIGNIESDGRPILGLDARDLLEIMLEMAPEGFMVPAHIWTPWFSLFGSRSGFDRIEDCFGDLTSHIFALETGLSSDPAMNRLLSSLDRFSLISNSDCHSPAKLGREANQFACGFNFFSMRDALKNPLVGGFLGTIEFFPEEGKYHHDGHRKCGINLAPVETRKLDNLCPVCGRPLTIGVMHRVLELADRDQPRFPDGNTGFHSLIPLPEVLGEIYGQGPATKKVMLEYTRIIRTFGSEFNLLFNVPVDEIKTLSSPVLAEAINRIRHGQVIRRAGYDGEFGVIRVFQDDEARELAGQNSLFGVRQRRRAAKPEQFLPSLFERTLGAGSGNSVCLPPELNPEQQAAVAATAPQLLVTAGPGTGKTFVLVARVARLLASQELKPGKIAAFTFTNRAADEMRFRLRNRIGEAADGLFIGTLHAFALQWLRSARPGLQVVGPDQRELIVRHLMPHLSRPEIAGLIDAITLYYQQVETAGDPAALPPPPAEVDRYQAELADRQCLDLDNIIPFFIGELRNDTGFRHQVCDGVEQLFIDEFQDLNRCQYDMVAILASRAAVFAIGDPDQAIYGFRGSSPEYFFRYLEEFRAESCSLIRNYRSRPAILTAAARVIANNPRPDGQERPQLLAELDGAGSIELYQAATPRAEAECIVQRIEALLGGISNYSINTGRGGEGKSGGFSFADIAILYRYSRQALALAEALERRGIPFQLVHHQPFFMQKEMKPLYHWLRIAASPAVNTEIADYLCLFKAMPGVGEASLAKLEKTFLFKVNADFFSNSRSIDLPTAARDTLRSIELRLTEFRNDARDSGLTGALRHTLDFLGIAAADPDPKRFLELAGSFENNLAGFCRYLQDRSRQTIYDEKAESVTLMTMHAAKGLEFPVVFMTGLEEGVMPAGDLEGAAIEEERRLFYVGMTRAREILVLTAAAGRSIFGRFEKQHLSRFVGEIPSQLLTVESRDSNRVRKTISRQMKLF